MILLNFFIDLILIKKAPIIAQVIQLVTKYFIFFNKNHSHLKKIQL